MRARGVASVDLSKRNSELHRSSLRSRFFEPLPLTSLQTRNLGVEPVVCSLRLVWLNVGGLSLHAPDSTGRVGVDSMCGVSHFINRRNRSA